MLLGLQLRDYQKRAIAEIYAFYRSGIKSVLLYAPTGAGKTVVAAKVIADAVAKGRRVLFVVHRVKLIGQTLQTLQKHYGIQGAMIWADNPTDYSKPVQVAMAQTLQFRDLPDNIGLVIVDEAHTLAYYQIMTKLLRSYSGGVLPLSQSYFLGLSGSPWRSRASEGFCQYFQAVVRAPFPQELIYTGNLCNARFFGYNGLIDFSQLEVKDGEYSSESMQQVCTPQFNAEVVTRFWELCPKRKAIAFCASVNQALDLAEQFNATGIKAEAIVADTTLQDRDSETLRRSAERIFTEFADGKVQIITSMGVLCEGFDEPSVQCVLLARPTRSRALLVQMSGRGLRLHPDKEDCYQVDFCENFKRLGFPTEKYKIGLCPRKTDIDAEPNLKECPNCHAMIPAFAMLCPECGHQFERVLPDTTSQTKPFGELLSPEQEKQCRDYRRWLKHAFKRNYGVWWADDKFKETYRIVPPFEWAEGAVFGTDLTQRYNRQIYIRYLRMHLSDPDGSSKEIAFYHMKREFGARQGQDGFRYLYWWHIFGVPRPFVDLLELEEFYRHQLKIASSRNDDEVALLTLAYVEGCAFFEQRLKIAKEEMLLKVWDKFLEVSSAASRAILEQFVSHIDIVGEELLVTTTAQPKMYQNLILPKIEASKPRLQNLVSQYGYWVDAVSCNTKLGMLK